ncbi:MAG: hypothetical protein FWD03_03805 [Defluviitaleaceae bacterium]|nr:hypothetical protein [Defluviitaleaceae bacterium]
MSAQKLKTNELLQRLLRTTSVSRFIKRYDDYMDDTPFHTYLKAQCDKRGLSTAHVIAASTIDRRYGYHIFEGKKNPSRDKVLLLAFGLGMDYRETQELLKMARKSALYPKILRDTVIIQGLEHGLPLREVQDALAELSQPTLGKEGRYE